MQSNEQSAGAAHGLAVRQSASAPVRPQTQARSPFAVCLGQFRMKSVEHTYESNGINGNICAGAKATETEIGGDASVLAGRNERRDTNTNARCLVVIRMSLNMAIKQARETTGTHEQKRWRDRERERDGDDDGNGK